MTGDRSPREFDGWSELRFAVTELEMLAASIGPALHADEDGAAITWSTEAWRAADLLERCYADIGTLAGMYLKLLLADKHGLGGLGGF